MTNLNNCETDCMECQHFEIYKYDNFGCGETELYSCKKDHFDEVEELNVFNCNDYLRFSKESKFVK